MSPRRSTYSLKLYPTRRCAPHTGVAHSRLDVAHLPFCVHLENPVPSRPVLTPTPTCAAENRTQRPGTRRFSIFNGHLGNTTGIHRGRPPSYRTSRPKYRIPKHKPHSLSLADTPRRGYDEKPFGRSHQAWTRPLAVDSVRPHLPESAVTKALGSDTVGVTSDNVCVC